MPQDPPCAACGIAGASLRCGRCKGVKYCTPFCQKRHWPAHKRRCKVGGAVLDFGDGPGAAPRPSTTFRGGEAGGAWAPVAARSARRRRTAGRRAPTARGASPRAPRPADGAREIRAAAASPAGAGARRLARGEADASAPLRKALKDSFGPRVVALALARVGDALDDRDHFRECLAAAVARVLLEELQVDGAPRRAAAQGPRAARGAVRRPRRRGAGHGFKIAARAPAPRRGGAGRRDAAPGPDAARELRQCGLTYLRLAGDRLDLDALGDVALRDDLAAALEALHVAPAAPATAAFVDGVARARLADVAGFRFPRGDVLSRDGALPAAVSNRLNRVAVSVDDLCRVDVSPADASTVFGATRWAELSHVALLGDDDAGDGGDDAFAGGPFASHLPRAAELRTPSAAVVWECWGETLRVLDVSAKLRAGDAAFLARLLPRLEDLSLNGALPRDERGGAVAGALADNCACLKTLDLSRHAAGPTFAGLQRLADEPLLTTLFLAASASVASVRDGHVRTGPCLEIPASHSFLVDASSLEAPTRPPPYSPS
ncbi:hypothetical protein JL722_5963 [Aureococcus anophagefferens]|nr:hypothetical protein JL722_5963 [Aureococcus anophagefferens]